MGNIRLFVAIPCSTPYMYRDWVIQFLNQTNKVQMQFATYGTPNDFVLPAINNHPNISTNRNELVRTALNKYRATHILFLDSDIIMPDGAIETMLKRDIPVHGLLCFTRDFYNPSPIMYKENKVIDPIPEGIIEVDSTGTGCLMIQREVFVKIADLPEFQQNGNNFFIFNEMWNGNNCKKLSEDRYFCMLAKKAGFKILVDTLSSCDHLTVKGVGNREYINAKERGSTKQQLLPLEPTSKEPTPQPEK